MAFPLAFNLAFFECEESARKVLVSHAGKR